MGENRTVASRTSYITNAVEQMVGHAGSREVASDAGLVNNTLKRGCKLVTLDSSGQATCPPTSRSATWCCGMSSGQNSYPY